MFYITCCMSFLIAYNGQYKTRFLWVLYIVSISTDYWRPEEIGAEYAKDIIEIVEKGLAYLKARPEYFEQFNSPNGWGMYEHFVPFVAKYLEAIKEYPEAKIEVSRQY